MGENCSCLRSGSQSRRCRSGWSAKVGELTMKLEHAEILLGERGSGDEPGMKVPVDVVFCNSGA